MKVPEWLKDLYDFIVLEWNCFYYYIYHRIHQSHLIDPKLQKGTWHEVSTKIESGLLELVDEYVSKEGQDAFAQIVWDDEECHRNTKAILIDALHFKYCREPAFHKAEQEYLDEMYGDEMSFEDIFGPISDERKAKMDLHNKMTRRFYFDQTIVLKNIVEIRGYLWT